MNDKTTKKNNHNDQTIKTLLSRIKRPKKALVTAGMPYANAPLHVGHLAGVHVPADIYSRWLKMLIGEDNVLFVCGTDDHGSNSEVAAIKQGIEVQDYISGIRQQQNKTLQEYGICIDNYTGTSAPDTYQTHKELCQEFLQKLYRNNMLQKRTSKQWFDPGIKRFLPDRYVQGTCPNPECNNPDAFGDECSLCGHSFEPEELLNPRSNLSDQTPLLRDTKHWWLDMWKVSDLLRQWIETKKSVWRKGVYNEVINTVLPCFSFSSGDEEEFKKIQAQLPKHKRRYAPGKQIVAQFFSLSDLEHARTFVEENGIKTTLIDSWAHRSITRDVPWGIPVPTGIDSEMDGKTLYVWPDSLIAPISFTKIALQKKEQMASAYKDYWCDENARIYQFLGQDNVFFYVLMQGALWLGHQDNPMHLPKANELQLTEIIGAYHLHLNGEKMSKSKGNFILADELIHKKGYHPEQIRYYFALLSLSEKSSNFELSHLDERNQFLAGPMNAAFEKPISAAYSQFDGKVPNGKLMEKAEIETYKIVQRYIKGMERVEFSKLLYAIENYARTINSLFAQFKPHDDRFPEEQRRDALFSCFYILKNLVIMLYPFVPQTMKKLQKSLNLPDSIYSVDELGTVIAGGHSLGIKDSYFPSAAAEKEKT